MEDGVASKDGVKCLLLDTKANSQQSSDQYPIRLIHSEYTPSGLQTPFELLGQMKEENGVLNGDKYTPTCFSTRDIHLVFSFCFLHETATYNCSRATTLQSLYMATSKLIFYGQSLKILIESNILM